MAYKTSYSQKLKDPRWQKKRLRVMERAEFACQMCGDTESMLFVHHGYYDAKLEPWDYPDATLHCVCENCHESAESIRQNIKRGAAELPLEVQHYLQGIIGYMTTMPVPDCFDLLYHAFVMASDCNQRQSVEA